jgi:hypothetical protein
VRRVPLLALAVGAALVAPGPALGVVPLVYAPADAANAIHDGPGGAAGLTTALRQSPIFDDPRWPLDRRVGKVTGRQLAPLGAAGIADALRAAWSERDAGGRVAIDEFVPGQWTDAGAGELAQAMRALGADAERVFVYASPALVAQAGRVDPRRPLTGRLASLFAATADAGRAYLELYTGNLEPLPARDMAIVATRWRGRWPAARADRLHALIGPGGATGQAEIWRRVRASPAGRAILANGPGAYGLPTVADGLAWLAAYRDFLASPGSPPPGGDTPVPAGGAVVLTLPPGGGLAPGAPLTLRFSRGGRAIVRLIDSAGRRRVIAARTIPASGGTLRATIPRRLRPGRYRLAVTLVGDGLTDSLERALRIRPATVTARVRVRLTAAGWALLVRPSAATRLTGRLEAASAGGGYARLRALAARRLAKGREAAIALGDLDAGRYRAVVRLGGGPPVTRAFRVTA